jgi:hypothetical protein
VPLGEGVRPEAALAEPSECVPVALERDAVDASEPVDPDGELESSRDAVTSGFFWRSDPAAAFRGFGAVRLPSAARRSFSRRNASNPR